MLIDVTSSNRRWGDTMRRADVVVDVKLTRRAGRDGWNVERRANGHGLGWLVPSREYRGAWDGYIENAAYWPADADIMVRTEKHRSHRGETWAHGERCVVGASTREEAIREMVWRLLDRYAEVVQPDFEATFPETVAS